MTSQEAYYKCAEINYAANYVATRDGRRVADVIYQPEFVDALPLAEKILNLHEELLKVVSRGGERFISADIKKMREDQAVLRAELASLLGLDLSALV